MRNTLSSVFFIAACFILFSGCSVKQEASTGESSSPVPSTSPMIAQDCPIQDLKATISLDAAAGNVYGGLTLQNTSATSCQVIGNGLVAAMFDSEKIVNVVIKNVGMADKDEVLLAPGQSLYSQIHYPNGPQCSSAPNMTPVTFTYAISSSDTVSFADGEGKTSFILPTCKNSSEITTIDIWAVSEKPVTPE